MSAHPYRDAVGVLDAAAAGNTVPGFEVVGKLLVDLGKITPLGPGVALRSSAVVGAAQASLRVTRFAALTLRKSIIVVSVMVLAGVVTLLAARGSTPDTVTDPVGRNAPGAESGNSGLVIDDLDDMTSVDDDVDDADEGLDAGNGPIDAPPSTTRAVEGADTVGATPSSTAPPVATSAAEDPVATTRAPTTTAGESEAPVDEGNNGNDNGNGVGNGKGNQGSGGNGGNSGGEKGNRGSD